MRATLVDADAEGRLSRYGFAVVPFLQPNELDRVQAVWEEKGPAPDDPPRRALLRIPLDGSRLQACGAQCTAPRCRRGVSANVRRPCRLSGHVHRQVDWRRQRVRAPSGSHAGRRAPIPWGVDLDPTGSDRSRSRRHGQRHASRRSRKPPAERGTPSAQHRRVGSGTSRADVDGQLWRRGPDKTGAEHRFRQPAHPLLVAQRDDDPVCRAFAWHAPLRSVWACCLAGVEPTDASLFTRWPTRLGSTSRPRR